MVMLKVKSSENVPSPALKVRNSGDFRGLEVYKFFTAKGTSIYLNLRRLSHFA